MSRPAPYDYDRWLTSPPEDSEKLWGSDVLWEELIGDKIPASAWDSNDDIFIGWENKLRAAEKSVSEAAAIILRAYSIYSHRKI